MLGNNIAKVRAFEGALERLARSRTPTSAADLKRSVHCRIAHRLDTDAPANEHVSDFRRNEFTKHGPDGRFGGAIPPVRHADARCHVPAAGHRQPARRWWDSAVLGPNYKKWMQTVDRALCSACAEGPSDVRPDLNQCLATNLDDDYGIETWRSCWRSITMDDDTVTPTLGDLAMYPGRGEEEQL